jgi:predicted kinase
MLIILSGLPGTGKTTIARELSRQVGAVYIRIDSIEQAMRDSVTQTQPIDDAGYLVGYAMAEDNLRLERTVIADSVNPLDITRNAWRAVASKTGARAIEVELICSDVKEHRRRVEERVSDIFGLRLPTWAEVVGREYHPWDREHLTIDTAVYSVERSVRSIRDVLQVGPPGGL